MLLWLFSRTTGLPLGPDPGTPETVGVPDLICVALEGLALPVWAALALRQPRLRERRWGRTALAAAPVVLVVAIAAFIGVGTGRSGMPAAFSAAALTDPGGVPITNLIAAPGAEPVKSFTLAAQPGTAGGHPIYTYNGTVPGPELRVTQGDRVRVSLVNHLPVPTTLHWHGLRVPAAEDGVAGLTQDAVAPGQSFTYEFVVSDAGTFWYHSHQSSSPTTVA